MGETDHLSWQKAVAELTAERGRAEAAAAVIKRLGGAGEVARAELTYGNGQAEADAVINAFAIALEEGKGLDDLNDLEARLKIATAARETLAGMAMTLAKAQAKEKSVVVDLLRDALPDLLRAISALWNHWTRGEASLRTTIAARLEATRWRAFAEIDPS